MPYPSKNSTTPTFSGKNSSTSSNSAQSGQNFLEIGDGFVLLIDTEDKLLIEPLTSDWSYAAKS